MVVVDSMQVYTAVAGRVVDSRAVDSRVAGRAVDSKVAGRVFDSRVAGKVVDNRVAGMVAGTLDMAYTLVVSRVVGQMDQAWLTIDWFVFPVYLFQWMLGIEFC